VALDWFGLSGLPLRTASVYREARMDRNEFEGMLVRVVTLGCAENVDWLFEHHGDAGVSKAALDDAVDLAVSKGHMQVARTLQVHCQRLG
jgi:hypothetical protein